jgi:hypothetical protein
MQIEITPYGRYLYSIGKFKPHSYEFVDDDVVYKISGSTEAQEAAHARITSETPKLKINRAFQDEAPQVLAPSRIEDKRIMTKKNNQRQSDLFAMGKSSYSSDKAPGFQISALKGKIKDSTMIEDEEKPVFIPQIEMDFIVKASLKRDTLDPQNQKQFASKVFDDGTYVDLSFEDKIIHVKELNSFYEKENFEIEVFLVGDSNELVPLRLEKEIKFVKDGLLVGDNSGEITPESDNYFLENAYMDPKNLAYYFDIEVDRDIPEEELCKVVRTLEVNNQFLDEELICPDQRTDRFDIYDTRVTPEDLEDCD